MSFNKNVGSLDSIIRLILAALFVILILFVGVSPVLEIILGILAVVFVATSIFKFCPIYSLLKLSTVEKK